MFWMWNKRFVFKGYLLSIKRACSMQTGNEFATEILPYESDHHVSEWDIFDDLKPLPLLARER